MTGEDGQFSEPVAVLTSGGVDSAALTVHLAALHRRVHPIFVRFGLRWEDAELAGIKAFLRQVAHPRVDPIRVLDEPVAAIYGDDHWSVGGPTVPGWESSDEAVYLPGRNLLLVTKAAVWCRLNQVNLLALGSLAGNPFPDSSAEFFAGLVAVINQGMDGRLSIVRPFAEWSKVDVLRRLPNLPWGLTFSCLAPDPQGRHCGSCNKCAERQRAFQRAAITDPTAYQVDPPQIS